MNKKKEALAHHFNEQHQQFYMKLAKDYLAYLGNKNPSINQLLEVQWLLSQTWVQRFIGIDACLTQPEATTLYLSARGKTTQQIAHFANLSPRQIERYRANIFKKLDCRNIAEAVMKGMQFLEIKPSLVFEEKEQASDE